MQAPAVRGLLLAPATHAQPMRAGVPLLQGWSRPLGGSCCSCHLVSSCTAWQGVSHCQLVIDVSICSTQSCAGLHSCCGHAGVCRQVHTVVATCYIVFCLISTFRLHLCWSGIPDCSMCAVGLPLLVTSVVNARWLCGGGVVESIVAHLQPCLPRTCSARRSMCERWVGVVVTGAAEHPRGGMHLFALMLLCRHHSYDV